MTWFLVSNAVKMYSAVGKWYSTPSELVIVRLKPPDAIASCSANGAIVDNYVVWNEFAGADSKVKTYLGLMLLLLAIGIGIVSTASLVPAY